MTLSAKLPKSVLFVCQLNSIRSPIAEGLLKKLVGSKVDVESCGLTLGGLDDLMVTIMKEKDIDMSDHESQTLAELDRDFDCVIAFTDEAGQATKSFFDGEDTDIEIWLVPDPTHGSFDVRAMMNNYRSVRDNIETRLRRKFLDNS